MEFIEVAKGAAERWRERRQVRDENGAKIKSGRAIETESAERIQLRLKHMRAATQIVNREQSLIATAAGAGGGKGRPLTESIGLERVIGKKDFLDANFMEIGLAVARFVGRINIRSTSGRSIGYGTGFMVSPRLLLTNNHVLGNADAARASEVEFDYQNDRFGRLLPLVGFGLDPDAFFMTDKQHDFALVAVREVSVGGLPLQRYGWSRLIATEGKALLGEALNIIQHPRGEPKQLVLRSNELVDLFDQFAHYVTDTEPGSSGSPVYNDQWEVVALHHSGVPRTDKDGKLIGKDGNVWTDDMDPDNLAWVANEGIRVSSLVQFIRTQQLAPDQARLRDELLTLEPPSAIETSWSMQDRLPASATAPAVAGVPAQWAAVQSFTLPLTISVQLGAPAASAAPWQAPVLAPPPGGDLQPGLREALAELEAAKSRVYYDKSKDAEQKAAYYGQFQPDGDPGAAYTALSKLLTNSHRTRLSYNPAKNVYPWVDLREGGATPTLRSIYSGKAFSAAELIESDFAIQRARESLRESIMRPGVIGTESMQAGEDFLEASLPFNCEHVVPQSWFNKKEPMRGDLHHLFACETGCNSFRGNIPYFDFADFNEVVRSECGKREEGKFEPGGGKGAVARATLYFLLRYPGQINRTAKEYTVDRIGILLKWHKQFPPDVYEFHRNAAIFAAQGNRNPLIDFPEWAREVDFERGLG